MGITNAGAKAISQALHHSSALGILNLSNNSISDDGTVALAQVLHHNSTLRYLDLSGNDGIGEEGTCQQIHYLNVTSMSDGLVLSKRCEQYVIQCTRYHTVKKCEHVQ